MAETLPEFVQRRRAGWQELEALLKRLEGGGASLGLAELERLDRLYRRASSDLALARTFFRGADATLFLNGLCARAYAAIYRRRVSRSGAVRRFFLNDLPGTFLAERRFFWLALAIMGAGALIGAIAAVAEPSSVAPLVPEELRDHIRRGSLWTDSALSVAPPLLVGSYITVNNLTVALSTFGMGLTAGVGTSAMLLFNGLHIGAVVALCFQAKLGFRLLGFMVAHGFVEISAILLAGQAGLILGAALIDPGELTRGDALRLRGRRAVLLLFGALPLLLVVGMVEGFVSPGQLFPGEMKLLLGLSLVTLLFGYLVRFGRAAVLEE